MNMHILRKLLLIAFAMLVGIVAYQAWLHSTVTGLRPHGASSVDTSSPGFRELMAEKGFKPGDPVFIRIFKESDELEVWMRGAGKYRFELLKTYSICRWSGTLGPKLKEGDRQAPEGFYFTNLSRLNPNSSYHLSFDIGFPNAYDRAHKRTGSLIMVHGNCVSIGCFAMGDAAIEEIYGLVEAALKHGQAVVRVQSFPFRMTEERMNRARRNQWIPFWRNLKEGYDWFEREHIPPNVEVKQKRYVFGPSA